MSDPRMMPWFGQHAGARYRCRVCRRFVRATDRGVCPSCGMPPPSFASVAEPAPRTDPAIWRRRLRWSAALGLEILALAALVYAALP
jgi:hypothetical protein